MTPVGILMGVVVAAALAAWTAAFSRAWIVANRSESFRALGFSRTNTWLGSLKHMPHEARAHLSRFFKAFAVVFTAIFAAVAVSIAMARP